MNNKQYYIKYIWGPSGQENYPEKDDNVIHFAEGSEKQCEKFRSCISFFLYETGHSREHLKGAKAIYAWGVIDSNQGNLNIKRDIGAGGKRWLYGARVILKKRINPKDGISLKEIKKLTGIRIIQKRGGLLQISENQFKKLRETLGTL